MRSANGDRFKRSSRSLASGRSPANSVAVLGFVGAAVSPLNWAKNRLNRSFIFLLRNSPDRGWTPTA
jgi:hypothetical protein